MGVRGLTKFFLERAPAAFQQIHLSMFRHEKIAFDGANILYAARRNGDDHIASLGTFFRRLVSEYDVHPVVVFDGSFPTWKRRETQLDRSHQEHELARLRRLHLRYSADTERTPCDRITLRIKQLLDRQIGPGGGDQLANQGRAGALISLEQGLFEAHGHQAQAPLPALLALLPSGRLARHRRRRLIEVAGADRPQPGLPRAHLTTQGDHPPLPSNLAVSPGTPRERSPRFRACARQNPRKSMM